MNAILFLNLNVVQNIPFRVELPEFKCLVKQMELNLQMIEVANIYSAIKVVVPKDKLM